MKYFLVFLFFTPLLLSNTVLNAHYYTKTDEVRLSDIIPNIKKDIRLYTIAQGKYTKRVKSKNLIALLKKYGYNSYKTKHSYVKFSKKSPINVSRIKEAISSYYKNKYKEIQINKIDVNSRGYVDKIPKHYTVKIKSKNYLRKDGTLFIESDTKRDTFFDFKIDAIVNVYKSRYKIKRNSELSHINTHKVPIVLNKFKAMPIQEIKTATMQSKYTIKEDKVLTTRDILKLFLVKRGSNISISLDSSNLSITFAAKAIQNGTYGDIITVMKSNGKRLKVLVTGKNRAEVR